MPGGSSTGHYLSTDTVVPVIAFVVDSSADPQSGDTVVATLYSVALGQYLDFNDMTFKAGSHADIDLTLTELGANAPGVYVNTFSLAAITNLSANDTLIATPQATTGKDPAPIEYRVDQWIDDFPTAGAVADQVWDEAIAGHVGAGSTGATLNAITAASVADAVWDEARSGHVTSGTFGEVLNLLYAAELACVIDGGSAATTASKVNLDSQGELLIARRRYFATQAAADAATLGAADAADSELATVKITINAATAGRLDNLRKGAT